MRRYMRQPEGSGEAAEEMAAGRKRKSVPEESELSPVQFKTRRLVVMASPEVSTSSASSGNLICDSVSSDSALSYCCSSSRSSELEKETPKSADLEENAANVEYIATSAGNSVDFRDSIYPSPRREVKTSSYFFRREQTTPSSEVQAESGELESTARPHESNPLLRSTAEKMPAEDELEDFLVAAEKNLQKQFIDKYNFDIVKEEPLEGRYEWVSVQLKP